MLEGLQVSDLKIASLLFADDVVLIAPTALDLQCSLDHSQLSVKRQG